MSCPWLCYTGCGLGVPVWLPVRLDAVCIRRHHGLQPSLSPGRPFW